MFAIRRGKPRTQALSVVPREIGLWHQAQGHTIRDARISVESHRSVVMIFISSVNGKNMYLWEKQHPHFKYTLLKAIKTRRGI